MEKGSKNKQFRSFSEDNFYGKIKIHTKTNSVCELPTHQKKLIRTIRYRDIPSRQKIGDPYDTKTVKNDEIEKWEALLENVIRKVESRMNEMH